MPTLDLAVDYQTSRRAGGDYYDFFDAPAGKLGIFLADASGHGTPATVMMAITHSIAHSLPGPSLSAGRNAQLFERATGFALTRATTIRSSRHSMEFMSPPHIG